MQVSSSRTSVLARVLSRLGLGAVAALVAAATLVLPARPANAAFTDVPTTHWAYSQITYVTVTNPLMVDFGITEFRPASNEQRKYWARTLVLAFAPTEPIDPTITFPDVAPTNYWYPFANVATKLGWIPKYASGKWVPNDPIRLAGFDRSLVLALRLHDAANGLAWIAQQDGTRFTVNANFPYLQIGRTLGFHINHSTEAQDIQATSFMKRDEAAYSLWKVKTLASWQIAKTDRFKTIRLGDSTGDTRAMIEYALNQVGQRPYIWSGEWNAASPAGYCCGAQVQAGMDCSGFMWWIAKRAEANYNSAQFRAYAGWSLPQRSSSEMARYTTTPLAFDGLQVGDLMFFASNGGDTWSDVDHVGMYAGNGFMIHTASSNNGALLDWAGDGWYRDKFVYGRRIVGGGSGRAVESAEDVTVAGDLGAF